MTDLELQERLDFAIDLCLDVGDYVKKEFEKKDFQIRSKTDGTPVTNVDIEAERQLVDAISDAFPHDAILGEEFGEGKGTSGFRWVLDPIDGTKAFSRGIHFFGTLVGIEFDGQVVAGMIYVPSIGEYVYASKTIGAWHCVNGVKQLAKIHRASSFENLVFVTSELETWVQQGKLATLEALIAEFSCSRTWGDCYGYLLLATGRVDLFIDPFTKYWDIAAAKIIVEQAGGEMTNWSGETENSFERVVAAHPKVLSKVLKLLK